MAQKYVQIIFRNDSCENWKQNNPVLDKSELGFAFFSDGTWRYKVGDGKTPWNELSWSDSNLKVVNDEIYYFSEDEGWINTHISVRDGKAVSAENADTADKLKTARTIALSGDVSGETNFDGSANVTINTTIADDSHLHDGRYYTEAEVDTKLSGKTDTGHKHTKSDITDFPTTMPPTDHTHTKSQITDFPTTMPPTSHTHDDRYYTESEVDVKLSVKSDADHIHDNRYYTESEVDNKLSGKTDTGHKHTKSDITDFPTSMTPVSHASTGTEFGVSSADNYGHAKAGISTPLMDGAAAAGSDNGYYARADHRHPVDTSRAAASHTHTKSQITDFPVSMDSTSHTHDASDITQDSEHRMVSDTQTASWDDTYEQSTAYTDKAISDLVGGAPTTLDTLKEIADAMQANETVIEALDAAIGSKASQLELDSHIVNSTVHVTASEKTAWNNKSNTVHKHTIDEITDFPVTMPPTAHTHTKSHITDFPASMPASDVYAWAKQPNKPSYAYNEITGKPSTFTPATHTHDYLPSTGGTVTGGVVIDKPDSENDLIIGSRNNYNNKVFTMQNRSRIFNICVDDDGSVYFKADDRNIISIDPGTNDPPYFEGIARGNPSKAELTSELNKKANVTHTHTKSQITDFPTTMPPTPHASSGVGYGVGNTTNYGHVKLSDNISDSSNVSNGIAATPYAVKLAYDKAVAAFQSASDGKILIANAITGKGVSASSTDSFSTLASKIRNISTGGGCEVVGGTVPIKLGRGAITYLRDVPLPIRYQYLYVCFDGTMAPFTGSTLTMNVNGHSINFDYSPNIGYYIESNENVSGKMSVTAIFIGFDGSITTHFSMSSS